MTAARRPESVLVVVHAGESVLLLRRKPPFDFWQSVTGSLEPSESAPQAAARELREETGIDASGELIDTGRQRWFDIDPRWRDRFEPGVTRNLEHEFRLTLDEPVAIALDDAEHSASEWLPLDDAIERVWSHTNRAALLELKRSMTRGCP